MDPLLHWKQHTWECFKEVIFTSTKTQHLSTLVLVLCILLINSSTLKIVFDFHRLAENLAALFCYALGIVFNTGISGLELKLDMCFFVWDNISTTLLVYLLRFLFVPH